MILDATVHYEMDCMDGMDSMDHADGNGYWVRVNNGRVEVGFPFVPDSGDPTGKTASAETERIKTTLRTEVGARWDGRRKVWYVLPKVALLRALHGWLQKQARLGQAFTYGPELRALADRAVAESRANLADSRASRPDVLQGGMAPEPVTGLGGELHPFQAAGVAYMTRGGRRVLNADDMGLGKTPQALAALFGQQQKFGSGASVSAHQEDSSCSVGCSCRPAVTVRRAMYPKERLSMEQK